MFFNIKDLMNTKYGIIIKRFGNSNFVAKILVGFILWFICLIPAWLYIITMVIVSPDNFWKGFAITVLFVIMLGWLQAIGVGLGIIVTIYLISET